MTTADTQARNAAAIALRDAADAVLQQAEAHAKTIRQTRASEDAGSPEAATVEVVFERIEWSVSRCRDRVRSDPTLAAAFLKEAERALADLAEEAEPPLTPVEQEEAWQHALDLAGDESQKDRARELMAEWGKIGARETLAYLSDDGDE